MHDVHVPLEMSMEDTETPGEVFGVYHHPYCAGHLAGQPQKIFLTGLGFRPSLIGIGSQHRNHSRYQSCSGCKYSITYHNSQSTNRWAYTKQRFNRPHGPTQWIEVCWSNKGVFTEYFHKNNPQNSSQNVYCCAALPSHQSILGPTL